MKEAKCQGHLGRLKCPELTNKCLVTYVKDATSESPHFTRFQTAVMNVLPAEYESAYVPVREML